MQVWTNQSFFVESTQNFEVNELENLGTRMIYSPMSFPSFADL